MSRSIHEDAFIKSVLKMLQSLERTPVEDLELTLVHIEEYYLNYHGELSSEVQAICDDMVEDLSYYSNDARERLEVYQYFDEDQLLDVARALIARLQLVKCSSSCKN